MYSFSQKDGITIFSNLGVANYDSSLTSLQGIQNVYTLKKTSMLWFYF